MKKHIYLLAVPFLLTACFNDNEEVTAPEAEDPVLEESVEDTGQDQDQESSADESETDGETYSESDQEDENEDGESDDENSDEEGSSDQSSNNSTGQTANTTSSNNSASGSTNADGDVSENQESDAIDAVVDYAGLEEDNYLFLTHLEDDGVWLQVEVREEMADQSQTNLVALYRQNLETGDLEEFDFILGEYQAVE